MFKKTLSTALLVICYKLLVMSCFAQEEKLTITTYYPSPYGSYRVLAAQRMKIGDNYSGSNYCWSPDSCPNIINSGAGLVVEGNVGLGTVDPWQKIHLKGGHVVFQSALVNDSIDLQFYDANDTSGNYKWDLTYRGNSQGDDLQLIKNAVGPPVMTWQNSTGNVGIGTAAPSRRLEVVNGGIDMATFKNTLSGGSAMTIGVGDSGCGGVGYIFLGREMASGAGLCGGRLGSDLVIANNGNVGIGTANPGTRLDVSGFIRPLAHTISYPTSGTGIEIYYDQVADHGVIDVNQRGPLVRKKLSITGTPILLNEGGFGNVGIGTVSPQAKLDVAGRIKVGTTGAAPPGFGNTLSWGGGAAPCTIGTLWVEDNGVTAQLCFCGRRSGGSFRYCW